MEKNNTIKFFSILFFTGAVVLSLELLASRILTPFFGVSLYIWTSILSVTLIFLAIGYQFGGWITSKIESEYYEELFIFIPFVSSIFILISTITYPILFPRLINLDLLVGTFLGSFLLLSIPLVLMSSLNPILISIIKKKNDQSSDSKSGSVMFISTIGSVFGVIFTALFLIPNFTNFSSFILNAIFLITYNFFIYIFIGYSSFKKLKKLFIFLNILLLVILLVILFFKENYLNHFTTTKDKLNNEYFVLNEYPSFYGNFKVVEFRPHNQENIYRYALYQNGQNQNYLDEDGNSLSIYHYTLDALSQIASKGNVLMLGLGAGTLPKKLVGRGFNMDVVDIDPKTFDIAKKYFKYKPVNTNIFFEDARTFVRKCKKKYELIIIDLFFSGGVPEHLTTKEFYNDLNNCLSNDGIVITNSLMDFSNELALNSVLSTFNVVFKNVYYFNQVNRDIANLYVIASNKKDLKKLNGLQPSFEYLPNEVIAGLNSVLVNLTKFENKKFNDKNVIYDEKNSYSNIFAKSLSNFRKDIRSKIPSRLLIN